jgi:ligand-binding sensor domain-containing protein
VLYYKVISFFVVFIFLINSFGQQLFHQEINTSNGAPIDRIYDLSRDKDDALYLGTEQGIYRFTGIKFEQIKINDAISNSITDVSFTKQGVLWCRNFSNQIFYSKGKELYAFESINEFLKGETIINLKIINDNVYVATYDAVYVFGATHKKFLKKIPFNIIETIHPLGNYLVVSTIDGVHTYIENTAIKFSVSAHAGNYRLAGDETLYFVEKNKKDNWIYQIDSKSKILSKLIQLPSSLNKNGVINYLNYKDGKFILSTNFGAYLYHKGKWLKMSDSHNNSDFIEDFQGGYWLSTIDNGLIHIPSIDVIIFSESKENQYYRHIISSPRGYLVSTNKGEIIEITKDGDYIRTFDSNTGWEIEFITLDNKSKKLYTSVGAFDYNNPNNFKFFYFGKGLSIDKDENIYYGTQSYSIVIKNSDELPIKFPHLQHLNQEDIPNHFLIRKTRTRDIITSQLSSVLYVAQIDKLLMYNASGEKELKTANGKPIHGVKLYIDDEDNLWVATLLQGVFRFRNGKLVQHYNTVNGLKSDNCINISGYKNFIYVVTNEGVVELNKSSNKMVDLTTKYALNNLYINNVLKDENSLLLVTKKGIVKLDQKEELKIVPPLLGILGIKNDKGESIPDFNQISYGEKSIEISWKLLNFQFGEKQPIYYRLKNYEQTWRVLPATINSVTYNNLSHGKYVFEIKVDSDSRTTQELTFSVLKPFWLTWWFIIIQLFFGVLILYLTIRITKSIVQKRQKVKENLILSQLTALRSQMNPHFLYNVLNSLQGLIYSNKANEAGNYVSIFSDHLRNVLKMSDKQWVTLKEEIDSLEVYLELEKLRFGDDFNYTITKQQNIDELIKIPSMILQPYVENSVKHGLLSKNGDKKVAIQFELETPTVLKVSIIDNGIGREKSAIINKQRKDKPKSFATQAIDSRIDLINKQLKTPIVLEIIDLKNNELAAGTAVYFKIPINGNIESFNS